MASKPVPKKPVKPSPAPSSAKTAASSAAKVAANAEAEVAKLDQEIVKLINGPEAFTPDGGFLLGEAPEVRGFFVAAGFNAHGIAAAGGVGKVLAEWIVEGQPHLDVWRMDIRRFGRHYRSRRYALAKTSEAYARHYEIHYPFQESEAGRNLRLSPVHSRVAALGAALGEKGGWERPNWYAPNERAADIEHEPRGWMRRFWSPAIGVEHRATREAAGLFDFTSFSKMEVTGRGALRVLQYITDNDLDKPVGTITYTSMLNVSGGIECDLTVTRKEDELFRVVTGSDYKGMLERGRYVFYQVGIGADGLWHYFVASE